jgi:hypothetical protein
MVVLHARHGVTHRYEQHQVSAFNLQLSHAVQPQILVLVAASNHRDPRVFMPAVRTTCPPLQCRQTP